MDRKSLGDEYELTESGGTSAFLIKFDSVYNVKWSKQINANNYVGIKNLWLDEANDIHIFGSFKTTAVIPGQETEGLISLGQLDTYLLKFHSTPQPGDINGDGLTNITDLTLFIDIFGCEDCEEINLDEYPGITTTDLIVFISLLDL